MKVGVSLQAADISRRGYTGNMTGLQVIERLRRHGCVVIRRSKGSHVQVRCGECQTTVPEHGHEDIGPGLLRKIDRIASRVSGKDGCADEDVFGDL